MLRLALKLMRNSVKRKAGCDINAVSPLDVVGKSLIPAMFGHGEEDSFINIQHSGVWTIWIFMISQSDSIGASSKCTTVCLGHDLRRQGA